ncbi:MAG: HEAT repeat domain-containing protein [Clostridia bacterium]|nr:HEAT repeat domain-containing protein [Clostridia bacterium]
MAMTIDLTKLDKLVREPEGQVQLLDYARQVASDYDRAGYLIKLTRQGNAQAAEELLEMRAILGELTCISKEMSQALKGYLAEKGIELTEKLLEAGNIPKIKALAQQLKKLPDAGFFARLAALAATFLRHSSWASRQGALEILAKCPEIRGEWLLQAYLDQRVYTRALALRLINRWMSGRSGLAISGLEGEALYTFVLQACSDQSPLVREKAILALANLQHPEVAGHIREVAARETEPIKVRMAAIQGLSLLLSVDEFWHFLYTLGNDPSFSMRLYVRELAWELAMNESGLDYPGSLNGEPDPDDSLYWGNYYCFWSGDKLNSLDLVLQEWWEAFGGKVAAPRGKDQELLAKLRNLGPAEAILPQILDFYLEGEERILGKPGAVRSAQRFQTFRSILLTFGIEGIPQLTRLLNQGDVHLRSAAIEALAELALTGQSPEPVKTALVKHLKKATNPPDQERALAALYAFPHEDLIPEVLPFLSSVSPKVVVQAASLLNSLVQVDDSRCINTQEVLEQIMNNVRERKIFGRLWGDLALYTAKIFNPRKCGFTPLETYLRDQDYLVRRFAREVEYNTRHEEEYLPESPHFAGL